MLEIIEAQSDYEIQTIRKLFEEYASSLNFNLSFQNFDEELNNLPSEYASPDGSLMLALHNGSPAGCVGLRKITNDVCEMKRLYVRDNFRGLQIGKSLTEKIIAEAKRIGYKKMRLDTVPSMKAARKLYKSLGFYKTDAYRYNPVEGTIYMELDL